MTFTIPDVAAAWNPIQARIQSGDVQIWTDAANGVGVVSGAAVAPQGTPDMTVAVASGVVRIGDATVAVASGSVTITANATGNPRLDLICVNASGTKSAQAGTAAASPKYPAIPASSVVLAAVLVPTGAASIAANNIVDKRALVTSLSAAMAGPGVIYVAASDAGTTERARADYLCDGTADNVQIQAAIDAAAAAQVGTVLLSAGTFDIAAEINLLGADDVDVEGWLNLQGQGPQRTVLSGAPGLSGVVKIGAVWKGRLASLSVECVGGTHGIRAVATNTAGAGYRSFWGSTFEDLTIKGPWDTTHTGWAMHLESPFRSTFRNIEMGGVGSGIRLFSSNDNFNPGDCTFERCFADLSGNTKTAYSVESTAATGNMNQIVFTMVEAIASGTGCTGIYLGGSGGTPGPVNHCEFFGVNLEQFDTLIDINRGQGNVVSCNYVECRGVDSLTAVSFGANAYNNRVSRIGMLYSANTVSLVTDGNTALPGAPNIVENVKVYADTGSTVSVTKNTAKTTILRDVVTEGAGTVSAGVKTAAVFNGSGTPEANVTAPIGSLYQRTDGSAGAALYRKESGTGNTGWIATGTLVTNVKDYGATGDGSTNDNTAIQAAITAMPAAGGTLYFPPGTYLSNTAALSSLPNGSRVLGAGRGASILKSTSGTHNLWTLTAGATNLSFDSLKMQVHSSGGHVFAPAGQVTFVNMQNLAIIQINPAKSIWKQGNFGYYFNNWIDCYLYHDGATSVPAMDFTSATSGIHNANTWQQCSIENTSAAATWFFDFATSAAGDYLYDNIFRDLTCEVSNGGIARLRSCNAFVFDNVDIYDQTTTAQHLFWVGAGGGAVASRQNVFRRVARRGGTLGSGLVDIFLESGKASDTKFEHCNTANGSGFTVDLSSNTGALAIGCVGVTFNNAASDFLRFAVGTGSGTLAAGDDARITTISFEVAGRVGTLAAETAGTTKTPRLYNRTGRTWTITAVYASVDTAPTGSGVTAVLRKDGSGTGAINTTIAASANTGSTTGQSLSVPDGSYLQAWPTAVGSTIAGTDLSVLVVGVTA